MAGENMLTHTDTITVDSDVEMGQAVDFSGTPTNSEVWGVATHGASTGEKLVVARSGPCQIQAADASFDKGDQIQLDANGRAIALAAGTAVGEAEEDGVAAVGGVYSLKYIYLYPAKR